MLIEGGLAVDDRGIVRFVNDFGFEEVRRFYTITNHRSGYVRAWHAHRREAKYITVVAGSVLIGAVRIDDWDSPAREASVQRFTLSASRPTVLYIPAGYANGWMSLTPEAQLCVFSSATLDESRADDVRYDSRYWDIWEIAER